VDVRRANNRYSEACLWFMAENDPLIIVGKATAMIVAATGVSVSQRLVCLVLKTSGYCPRKIPSSLTAIFHLNRN